MKIHITDNTKHSLNSTITYSKLDESQFKLNRAMEMKMNIWIAFSTKVIHKENCDHINHILWYCFFSNVFIVTLYLSLRIERILVTTRTTLQNTITFPIQIITIARIVNGFTTNLIVISSELTSFHTSIVISMGSTRVVWIPEISPVVSSTLKPSGRIPEVTLNLEHLLQPLESPQMTSLKPVCKKT